MMHCLILFHSSTTNKLEKLCIEIIPHILLFLYLHRIPLRIFISQTTYGSISDESSIASESSKFDIESSIGKS